MNDSDLGILLLFLFFAAFIIAHAVYVALRKPNRRVPTLPVNQKNLRGVGYLRSLTVWFVYFPLVAAAAGACWLSGRMSGPAALATLAILLCIPSIQIHELLRLQRRPLLRALREQDFDEMLRGKEFLFLKGAWQYVDEDWFLRVGNGYSAALRARWIDFSKPALLQMHPEAIVGGGPRFASIHRFTSPHMHFTGRDGSEIVARLDRSPDIVKWVKRHGGRIRY